MGNTQDCVTPNTREWTFTIPHFARADDSPVVSIETAPPRLALKRDDTGRISVFVRALGLALLPLQGARMAMTVLVVDDSATMVVSLKTTLAMSGFAVETAGNGQAALDKLKAGLKRT